MQAKLRQRMENAVMEDARQKALDAAKKRAVAQRCDVETFQALVSAAHLRPMRGTGLRIAPGPVGKPAAPRCFAADGSITAPAAAPAPLVAAAIAGGSAAVADEALRSGAHWARAWRAAPAPADRRRLLRRACAAGALPRLLRLELSSRLLEDMLGCLELEEDLLDAPAPQHQHPAAAAQGAPAAQGQSALAATVLAAAAGAGGFAVARAGLSLHGRQLLERMAAAHGVPV
ncbi:hypothetical protein ABPG75_007278 [Micractinium tetrahymenae]